MTSAAARGQFSRERQSRDGKHVDRVSDKCNCPVSVCFVCEVPRDGPEPVADQLTESGNEAYDGSACTEGAKERSDNTSGSFVGHVCEEVDDSNDQDKSEGKFCYVLLSLNFS